MCGQEVGVGEGSRTPQFKVNIDIWVGIADSKMSGKGSY